MSAGLRNSTIETFRRRTHGDAVLKLYQLRADGESLTLLATLTKGFYIATNRSPMQGAVPNNMVIDTAYTDGLTESIIRRTAYADLVADTRTRRYKVNTDNPPTSDDWRFVIGLHPAFNDTKTVV